MRECNELKKGYKNEEKKANRMCSLPRSPNRDAFSIIFWPQIIQVYDFEVARSTFNCCFFLQSFLCSKVNMMIREKKRGKGDNLLSVRYLLV